MLYKTVLCVDKVNLGNFLHQQLIPHGLKIEATVNCLEGEKKHQFLSFARKILQWLPEDRKTAKELIEDPWLSDESIRQGGS